MEIPLARRHLKKSTKRPGAGLLSLLRVVLIALHPGQVTAAEPIPPELVAQLDQGQALYESGQLSAAQSLLESALQTARSQNANLAEAIVLSNLALVYGQSGQWTVAETAMQDSLQWLEAQSDPDSLSILAQALTVQGRLQFGQNHPESALASWRSAATVYEQVGDPTGMLRSQLHQASALQAMGFHRRAQTEVLAPLQSTLAQQPSSTGKAAALRQLATAYQVLESLDAAEQAAVASLAVASEIEQPLAIEAAHLKLGNIAAARLQEARSLKRERTAKAAAERALDHYQTVVDSAIAPRPDRLNNRLRAQLNQLDVFLQAGQGTEAGRLWPTLLQQLTALRADKVTLLGQLKLAESLLRLRQLSAADAPTVGEIRQLLQVTKGAAQQLEDQRTQAYAEGYLGQLALMAGDLPQAQRQTEQALFLAQASQATEMSYRWYEQLGKVAEQKADRRGAIANYTGAVQTLKHLRSDLVSVNPQIQFSFQKSVEPLHRKLISLLLDPAVGTPSQANLIQARDIIESLREEELNDYLRAACLDTNEPTVNYDVAGTEQTAFIHTIILDDRLELIAKLPGQQTLQNYASPISKAELEAKSLDLRTRIGTAYYSNSPTFEGSAQQLYQVLFESIRKDQQSSLVQDLTQQQTEALAFILDGSLRNIPISALYDGAQKQFVLEKFEVATTPSLRLLNAQPRQGTLDFDTLTYGLSEGRQGFEPLPNVRAEVDRVCTLVNCDVQFNEAFTREQFLSQTGQSDAPIVHLATHGQFGTRLDETFILTWDETLSISDFNQWLRSRTPREPTELLVLSACETALGDDRTTLGLAGVAARAGARSTVASLWKVDDLMASLMIPKFYEALSQDGMTKAKALQTAQRYIVEAYPEYKHPYYWSAFILVGSWL